MSPRQHAVDADGVRAVYTLPYLCFTQLASCIRRTPIRRLSVPDVPWPDRSRGPGQVGPAEQDRGMLSAMTDLLSVAAYWRCSGPMPPVPLNAFIHSSAACAPPRVRCVRCGGSQTVTRQSTAPCSLCLQNQTGNRVQHALCDTFSSAPLRPRPSVRGQRVDLGVLQPIVADARVALHQAVVPIAVAEDGDGLLRPTCGPARQTRRRARTTATQVP